MNLRPWMSRRFVVAALALAGLFVLLLTAMSQLIANEGKFSGDISEDVVWFASQGQYEAIRLADALSLYGAGKVSHDDLVMRFDLLDSRILLFEQGDARRQVAALGFAEKMGHVRVMLDDTGLGLGKLAPGDDAGLSTLHAGALALAQTLRDLANAGVLHRRDSEADQRDDRRQILFEILGLLVATGIAGVFVGGVLVGDQRNRVRTEAALERERQVSRLHRAFTSVVSHQFRTPISIIDASAQRMIRRGAAMTGEEIVARAEKIRHACLRLTRLMESTLNAARLEQGEIRFNPRPTDLARLIAAIRDSQPEEDQARLELDLDALPVPVLVDRTLIEQAIQNLVSNALKYSPVDRPVRIRGETRDGDIALTVTNSGVGIPADEIASVFTRFFRARTAEGIPGTGIGLNFVAEIIALHGGQAQVESVEGGGSTFTLRFPWRRPEAEAAAAPLAAPERMD